MRSNAHVGGHPLHPMLVIIPVGLFIWALVSDIIYLSTGDRVWYDISMYTGIAAIVTALVESIPGFIDYFTLPLSKSARSKATIHMVLNLGIVALCAVAAYLQWDDGAIAGDEFNIVTALHGIGAVALVVSGWLGGELAYRHHIGMVPDNTETIEAQKEDLLTPGPGDRFR
ncbi:MAG: DUF2231 domain-containing protein [SAR202 cluster bacterium]|nr:DUF2231 domain-containing protein [SAR202 cluster bacterium]